MSEKLPTPGVDSVWNLLNRLSSVVGLPQQTRSPRDRRKHKRIPMAGKISYKESGTDIWNAGWIQDFSLGGVRITASQAFSVGQTIDLRLILPIHNDPTDLEAQVIWVREGAGDLFDIGVCFSKQSAYQVQVADAAANKIVALALQSANELSAHQALSIEDLQSNLALTYKEHDPDWPGTTDEWARRCNKWIFHSNAATFILKSHEQAFGTITLVQDSELGLPSDHLFPRELAQLRTPDRKLAEITLLGLDSELLTERFAKTGLGRLAAFIRLLKIAFDYAQPLGITDLLIAASPTDQNTFSYLLFTLLSNWINPDNTESLALMHLNIAYARAHRTNIHAGILAYLYDTASACNRISFYITKAVK
jgi:hypothetical protein